MCFRWCAETTPSAFRTSLGATVVRSTFVRAVSLDHGNDSLSLSGTGRGPMHLPDSSLRHTGTDAGAATLRIELWTAHHFPPL